MHEVGVVAKDVVEKVKDVKEVAQELGDKKVYGDITGKDVAQTGGKVLVGYVAGGPVGAGLVLAREVSEPVVKKIAEEAGASKETAENSGKIAKRGVNIASIAMASENIAVGLIEGSDAISGIGEAASDVVDYDVPVVQISELSGSGKNLIASDTITSVSELDLPVATNVEKPNEAVTGVVAKFGDGKLSEDITSIESNLIKIDTRNQALEGTVHPETGVPFVRKVIDIGDGMKVEGVFPEFDSKFDVQLPEDMLKSSDVVQFNECNNQLKEAVEASIDKYKSIFNDEQIEQILSGETPDGYTWHHDAEVGKMQLVDSDIHMKTGHTGGRTVWGGGNENR